MTSIIETIDRTECVEPTLWYLGAAGFAVKYFSIVFYVDPWLPPNIDATQVSNADMVLRTHFSAEAQDPTKLILEASPRAKVIVHKDAAETLKAAGIGYHRMTTTDAGLRVEYFKTGAYGRVYSVPARPNGLGYLIRFGQCTIYHPGVSTWYEGLAEQLKPYNVTVALLPIGEKGFSPAEAASIQAEWLVPMNCDPETTDRFTDHLLGHHPERRFKIFEREQSWTVPSS